MIVESKEFSKGTFYTYNEKPDTPLFEVNQIHSNKVVHVESSGTEADGIISSYENNCAIKTADCLVVLFLGADSYSIIHAGWRGLASNILLDERIKKINPEFIHIGTCISEKNYEVQKDFMAQFPQAEVTKKDGKLYFDLARHATEQLDANFPNARISSSQLCTFDDERLHSYRRNRTSHRNWHIFIPHQ